MEVIEKDEDFLAKDENFLIIQGKCSNTRKIYLLKYILVDDNHGDSFLGFKKKNQKFNFDIALKAPDDYEFWSGEGGSALEVNVDLLSGMPEKCPHCGNSATICLCSCGKLCCAEIKKEINCPNCNRKVVFAPDSNFSIKKSRG